MPLSVTTDTVHDNDSSFGSRSTSPASSSSASSDSPTCVIDPFPFHSHPVLTYRTIKAVRFLVEHPHNDNNTSTSIAWQIFMPKEPAPEVPKLKTAACRWKKCHFKMLNVDYEPNDAYTFDFEFMQLSPKLSQRIIPFHRHTSD